MDENQKSILIHYLTEFIIGIIGLGILVVILWFQEFQISMALLSIWIFLFNGVIFSYWIWKSRAKPLEKIIIGIYFVLLEVMIANSFTSFSLDN
jgi:hypothetical protein|tara:strand:- start:3221 stop:3502 length:282 start_codon:yes stop_codon:yes gene_type:complete